MKETSLNDEKTRLALLDASNRRVEASKDPLIQLAVASYAYHMKSENQAKELEGELLATLCLHERPYRLPLKK